MDTFTRAIEGAGSLAELCRRMSRVPDSAPVTPQVFSVWRRRGQVPENRVWQFAEASGIAPWEIRPDIFDRPEIYLSKVAKIAAK